MKSINSYLREQLANISAKNISVAPNISDNKLNNAVKSFGYNGSASNVVGIFDSTLLKNGKDGLLFTGEQLIHRATFAKPVPIKYSEISGVELIEKVKNANSEKTEQSVAIKLKDGTVISIGGLANCDYSKLTEILTAVVTDFEDFKEEDQLTAINNLTEVTKVAYVSVVINLAYENDGKVDDKETAEILLLMTRLDLSSDSRLSLRMYMVSAENLTPLDELLCRIDSECQSDQLKAIHISLVKDLINLYYSAGNRNIKEFGFLQTNRSLFNVTDEEIDLAAKAIETDYLMLKDGVTDDQVKAALKLLSSKASAVGVPIAAVYLSGSVVGMSAAGLTSGLATLGMGGLLGLSSMATGIGVVVLIGVGTYAGVRKLTGANEMNQSKRRELMLAEIIKQTQRTISLVIQDINHLTIKLNEMIVKHGTQDEQIKKLVNLMARLAGAGSVLTDKSTSAQASAVKVKCAQFLDEKKLRSLTNEPTKAELFDIVRNCYVEKTIEEAHEDEVHVKIKLVIKENLSVAELENLAKAFEVIGYSNVTDIVKGSVMERMGKFNDEAGKVKDKLSERFS